MWKVAPAETWLSEVHLKTSGGCEGLGDGEGLGEGEGEGEGLGEGEGEGEGLGEGEGAGAAQALAISVITSSNPSTPNSILFFTKRFLLFR